jgi:hypothetical protein
MSEDQAACLLFAGRIVSARKFRPVLSVARTDHVHSYVVVPDKALCHDPVSACCMRPAITRRTASDLDAPNGLAFGQPAQFF